MIFPDLFLQELSGHCCFYLDSVLVSDLDSPHLLCNQQLLKFLHRLLVQCCAEVGFLYKVHDIHLGLVQTQCREIFEQKGNHIVLTIGYNSTSIDVFLGRLILVNNNFGENIIMLVIIDNIFVKVDGRKLILLESFGKFWKPCHHVFLHLTLILCCKIYCGSLRNLRNFQISNDLIDNRFISGVVLG